MTAQSTLARQRPPASVTPAWPPPSYAPVTRPMLPRPPRPPRTRLAGLDGLRAIAVIMVMLYHFVPGVLPGGFVGVDVFFVVSGFIITYLLVGERARGTVRLGAFWLRRARRLLPALVTLVLVCSAAAYAIGGDVLVRLGSQVLGAFTFSSNWIFIAQDQSYFAQSSPQLFRNLWSLAVEEQFYLVWPFVALLLIAIARPGGRALIAAGIAAASAVLMAVLSMPGGDPSRVYYGSDTHAFGLAIGAGLAFLLHARKPARLHYRMTGLEAFERRHAGWLGVVALLGLIACGVWFADQDPLVYRGGLVLVCLLTAVVIWSVTRPRAWLGRMLDVSPMRAVGVRSYGLYLWHWPVLLLVEAALPTWSRAGTSGLWLAAIALGITVTAAVASYALIETPIRTRGFGAIAALFRMRRAPRRKRLAAAIVACCLLLTTGAATGAAIAAAPSQTAAELQIAEGQRAIAQAQAAPAPPVVPGPAPVVAAPTAPATPTPTPTATDAPIAAATPDPVVTPDPTPSATPDPPAAPVVPSDPQPGDQVTAIGDSVMLASAPALEEAFPGISIDAEVSRQARSAPDLVSAAAAAGTLRQTLLIGLGTNGYLGDGTLDDIRAAAGPDRDIVFVNVYADRPWTDEVNSDLAAFVANDPHSAVADWHDAIAANLGLLGPDQIHPGGQGGELYANCVAAAMQSLG